MLKLGTSALALIAIALATTGMTATAGSWPNLPAKKTAQASGDEPAVTRIARQESAVGRSALSTGDFEYIGGDTGWQLRQHQYTLSGANLVHSPQCTQVASAAAAATLPGGKTIDPAVDQLSGA